ncbi:catechol 2,3-dioxygenase-like lactoylglutathione lyase family enzyme [Constrictibacter sp. MBR-5]|uniref:VOC family protein n=1 Tax=Constrictibacter sp. MBR-5 TaxID=3156467 RepID=UPI003395ECD0
MTITATHLDHLVLTVRDIDRTCDFYASVLGMERRSFGEGRVALHFGSQKINLHAVDHPIDPNVRHATPGSSDLCFITATPITQVVAHLGTLGIPVITGPGLRSGARGRLMSVYVYDPDENLIEIANDLSTDDMPKGG